MGDMIPKSIDLNRVKLTPKGLMQLVLGFMVVMAVWEVSKWAYNKIRGSVDEKTGGTGPVVI